MRDLERAQSLLSTKYPKRLGLEKLFGVLLKEYLERHDPESRMKKRSQRGEKDTGEKGKKRTGAARTRHIPQAVRDEVFVRDGGMCTFVSTDGKRCGETRNLEIDHIIPYAKGGDNSPENLRLLCAQHNRLAAEDEYGAEHMEKFYRRE